MVCAEVRRSELPVRYAVRARFGRAKASAKEPSAGRPAKHARREGDGGRSTHVQTPIAGVGDLVESGRARTPTVSLGPRARVGAGPTVGEGARTAPELPRARPCPKRAQRFRHLGRRGGLELDVAMDDASETSRSSPSQREPRR